VTHGDNGRDELQGGSDRHPVRWPLWLRVLSGVVLALGIGWVAVEGSGDAGLGDGAEGGVTPSSSASDVVPPGTPPSIGVAGPPCVETDHRHELTVSVGIENLDTRRVYVRDFEPVLPLDGLSVTGGSLGSESCGDVEAAQGGSLAPGEAVVLTMTFDLPDDCPAPYPVRVDVVTSTEPDGRTFHDELGVLNDLGEVTFRQCGGEQ